MLRQGVLIGFVSVICPALRLSLTLSKRLGVWTALLAVVEVR